MRLVAGLRSDPLGELTALPRSLDGLKGKGDRRGKWREEKGEGGEMGEKGKGKDPNV